MARRAAALGPRHASVFDDDRTWPAVRGAASRPAVDGLGQRAPLAGSQRGTTLTTMEPNVARDPDVMSDARAKIHAALASDDPTTALRTIAIEVAGAGHGRTGAEALFVSVCEELGEAGRDEDAKLVAYVLDMIAEW